MRSRAYPALNKFLSKDYGLFVDFNTNIVQNRKVQTGRRTMKNQYPDSALVSNKYVLKIAQNNHRCQSYSQMKTDPLCYVHKNKKLKNIRVNMSSELTLYLKSK